MIIVYYAWSSRIFITSITRSISCNCSSEDRDFFRYTHEEDSPISSRYKSRTYTRDTPQDWKNQYTYYRTTTPWYHPEYSPTTSQFLQYTLASFLYQDYHQRYKKQQHTVRYEPVYQQSYRRTEDAGRDHSDTRRTNYW